jgi:hypothetical protein
LGFSTAAFALLTLLWRDWIEIVFRFSPDRHSGSVEWAIVAGATAMCVASLIAATVEWRRAGAVARVPSA